MTRKVWMMIALAFILGSLSIYLNRDWFATEHIQITDRSRPARGPWAGRSDADNSAVNPLVIIFSRPLKLTMVKVVPAFAAETNRFAPPVWHLVSESNSPPTKEFTYGARIRGMHPAVKGMQPEPLLPELKYRLFIEAGPLKAEHDFTPVARSN